jgi:D-lactate dehydrogenase
MRVAVFSTKHYDRTYLTAANARHGHDLVFFEPRLSVETARLADGFPAVCAFVHDTLDHASLVASAAGGVRLVALRSAGFNNVDLAAAADLGISVCRVPAYSPHAVAEYAVAQILATVRHIPRAYARVRDGNFSLDGLLGFDLHARTVGIVGTGRIGQVFARIMAGFGCRLLAYDPFPNDDVRALATYVSLEELLEGSDIISLHAPLTPETHHLVNRAAIARMRRGVTIVNTSRGALVDTEAVIDALKDGTIGYLGLDVYEEEDALFFEDLSAEVIQDDTFARLLTFPNVLVTAHQAFFTDEAMRAIAETTLANITAFELQGHPLHPVVAEPRS